jgi:4-nitrophenol 2-monooxygenase / 4-nitrocatechol 4-monooxygenase, reductase component
MTLPSVDAPLDVPYPGVAAAALDSESFRAIIGHFGSGVTATTARRDGEDLGATASAFTSLSLEPPMVLVCLSRGGNTEQAIAETGRFGVNILRDTQGDVAESFASRRPDRFAGLDVSYGNCGIPLLDGALAHLECHTAEKVEGGTHSVFLGRVVQAEAHAGRPLAYYRGSFGQFFAGDDAGVLATIRADIISGSLAPGMELGTDALADRLGTEAAVVLAALRVLRTDGYVERRPDGAFVVRRPDHREVLDMISACRTIEVGVAESTVGWVSGELLSAWEEMAMAPCPCHPASPGREHGDATNFHERMVRFSENRRLVEHYRELSPAAVRTRGMKRPKGEVDEGFVNDHLALVAAYRSENLSQVTSAIDAHARRLRHAWSEIDSW